MRMVSGTPCAVPDDVPKLERMSLRTTPLCVRTSGPFEPSPGKGPAVSSGMTVAQSAPAVAAPPLVAALTADAEAAPGVELADGAQPTGPEKTFRPGRPSTGPPLRPSDESAPLTRLM